MDIILPVGTFWDVLGETDPCEEGDGEEEGDEEGGAKGPAPAYGHALEQTQIELHCCFVNVGTPFCLCDCVIIEGRLEWSTWMRSKSVWTPSKWPLSTC